MKRLTLKWLACAALSTPLLLPTPSGATEPLPVVASFSILGDLVKVVGGERVKVTTLVGPDADAHTFEPTPTDAKVVLGARLLVLNGLHFEPWAEKLARSAGYKGVTLIASEGIKPLPSPKGQAAHQDDDHDHDAADPHAWQDPRLVMVYVKNIAKSLSSLDQAGADSYKHNSEAYLKELQALDDFAKAAFAPVPAAQRKVITGHQAFNYLGARYQIQFRAAQGISTQSDPSAKAVAQLIAQIRKDKIRAIFAENKNNTQLLTQIANEAGVKLGAKLYDGALSGPGEPASTYLQLMRYNITQLADGMKRN